MDHDPAAPVLLALRALGLGDLLVAVPALKGLRGAFPEHCIIVAAPQWLAPVVGLIDAVDALTPASGDIGTLDLDSAPGTVDVAVNLHGRGPESGRVLLELHPRRLLAHRPDAPDGPPWIEDLHERARWVRLVEWYGGSADPDDVRISVPDVDPIAADATVVHVGASYGSRRWPIERFAMVARTLESGGDRVVVTGGAEDRDRATAVAEAAGLPGSRVLAGELGLLDFASVVAAARVVVTVDTGAAHLASAFDTPSVVVFGPAPPERWGPPPGPHLVLTDAARRRGEVFADDPDPALLAVEPTDVLDALALLGRRGTHRRP